MNVSILPFSEFGRDREWKGYPELINSLCGHNISILGSQNELGDLNCPDVTDYRGKLSLKETVKVIKDSDLFIGNDGGLYHIATYLGVRTIVIFIRYNTIFRMAHFNKPNVRVLWRPSVEEVIENI
jgi:ADP-heptose:LPS heptosyltransferase